VAGLVVGGAGGDIARVTAWPDELRFAITVVLAIGLFAAAARWAIRAGGRGIGEGSHAPELGDWLADAILLALLAQYLVVGVIGLLGILGPTSITIGSAVAATLLWLIASRFRPSSAAPLQIGAALGDPIPSSLCLVLAELAAIIWIYLRAPVTANDALTYHLPAAVSWLQSGRLAPFDVWFYNPANTYSPLAGSIWAAWYLGPAGGDVVARFVQVPALLLLWAAVVSVGLSITRKEALPEPGQRGYSLASRARLGRWAVALVAVAVVTARPFISQAALAKDDAYAAGLFIAVVAALPSRRMNDRIGPWRLGTAVGLFFATKYTTLFSLPVLLLACDAPWRARWRLPQWLIATGMALVLAGPWYLRNALLTGNPLYPIDVNLLGHRVLSGMFTTQRSAGLHYDKTLETFTGGYYCISRYLAGVVLMLWFLGGYLRITAAKEPGWAKLDRWMTRLIIFGPPVGIGLFIATSPFAESRFVAPEIALLMIALLLWPPLLPGAGVVLAAIVAALALFGGFVQPVLLTMAPCAAVAAIILVLVRIAIVLAPPAPGTAARGGWWGVALIVTLVIAGMVYVQWPLYVARRVGDQDALYAQPRLYPTIAGAWAFVRDHTEPDATIAYTNFYYTYPLFGPDLRHRVVYAPTRPGIHHLYDLPHLDRPLSGDDIYSAMVQILQSDPDERTWRANLQASGAKYLVISMRKVDDEDQPATPPEAAFVARGGASFAKLYDDSATRVYRVESDSEATLR